MTPPLCKSGGVLKNTKQKLSLLSLRGSTRRGREIDYTLRREIETTTRTPPTRSANKTANLSFIGQALNNTSEQREESVIQSKKSEISHMQLPGGQTPPLRVLNCVMFFPVPHAPSLREGPGRGSLLQYPNSLRCARPYLAKKGQLLKDNKAPTRTRHNMSAPLTVK